MAELSTKERKKLPMIAFGLPKRRADSTPSKSKVDAKAHAMLKSK